MQTIWITGGSSGIGYAVAKKFLENNWRVVISSSNSDKLHAASEKLKNETKINNLYYLVCNVANYSDVEKTVNKIEKEISPINLALLNAAAYSPNKTQDFEIANYELLINVNLKGTINCIDVLKDFMKNRGDHISIVSSPVGFRGMPTAGAYGMTKAAQLNLA